MPEPKQRHVTRLSNDIWSNITSYLSLEDIQALKKTCKLLNKQLTDLDVAWQPFLNRLHEIDETISIKPTQGQKIKDAFIVALEKVRIRQLAEIAYLREKHSDEIFAKCKHIKLNDPYQKLCLKDLEEISEDLDVVNSNIIKPKIIKAINLGRLWLSLGKKGITRFPKILIDKPEYKEFWTYLESLFCEYNFLQILPSNIGKKLLLLKALDCRGNQLKELPESIGNLKGLEVLWLGFNKLTALPKSIDTLTKLNVLRLQYNELATVPSSIDNLIWLHELDLTNNNISELPESFQRKFGINWYKVTLANQKVYHFKPTLYQLHLERQARHELNFSKKQIMTLSGNLCVSTDINTCKQINNPIQGNELLYRLHLDRQTRRLNTYKEKSSKGILENITGFTRDMAASLSEKLWNQFGTGM